LTCSLSQGDSLVSLDTTSLSLTHYDQCLGFNGTLLNSANITHAGSALSAQVAGLMSTSSEWTMYLFAGDNSSGIASCNASKSGCDRRPSVTLSFQRKDSNGFWTTVESDKVTLAGNGTIAGLRLYKAGQKNNKNLCFL
jgi:hypothetical protein